MVSRKRNTSWFDSSLMALVLGVFVISTNVRADSSTGVSGAAASASIKFQIIIPPRLEVSFPDTQTTLSQLAQFRLNSGGLSVTSSQPTGDPTFNYLVWGNIHVLDLPDSMQIYTIASP